MADPIQCTTCGAVLLKEDLFCGECGAPRPAPGDAMADAIAPETIPPVGAIPTAPRPVPPVRSAGGAHTGWRVAAYTLLGLGGLALVAGLLVFILAGTSSSEGFTTAENWLFSAGCCLLPIAGFGVLSAVVGAAIWYTRLRNV
jgi:hypothetical protein